MLSDNAKKIFKDLYCFQGETIKQAFRRVAKEFANNKEDEKEAYDLLVSNVWRPNTPVFLNAGTDHKVFSACYVVGLEDSMESIYDIANVARKIFQYGAGIGIPIGNLRESEAYIYEGERERPPEGKSSGPIIFMKLYDAVGETTKSGGRVRRAAILCSMPVWHPDVIDFISCKEIDGRLSNMNISVLVTDKFMQSMEDGIPFDVITPDGGKRLGDVDPLTIWHRLADMAHKTADPGVIFIDTVNKYNPLIKDIMVQCTNPCGEQPLMPFGCCNLSAINLGMFVGASESQGAFDWKLLYNTAKTIMKLMDNTIDKMDYPDERFKENALKYRPIGVGIMGLADALLAMNLRYDGPDGRKFAADAMRTITTACVEASAELAAEHGAFHNYERYKDDMERIVAEHTGNDPKVMEMVQGYGVRNCQFTTAQPTGTTALSCDSSYGIEPLMGLVFQKNLISDEKMIIANPIFEERFKDEDWYTSVLKEKISNNSGSLKGIHGIPKEVRDIFVVAHDIGYKARLDMQAELQKYCSTAISSTVNLPKETTKDEVADLFKYAYDKGLKGVTIYRDGSKKNQPVIFEKKDEEFKRPNRLNAETFVVETGNGKMYVTVSDDDGNPVEVFLFLGKSGQILNTFSEALGRVISLALQNEVPLEKLTKTMVGINSDTIAWHRFEENDAKPTQILSIPDGIAKLLDKYYLNREHRTTNGVSSEICSKCGQAMVATEGCFSCSCGNSKCS
jgi:ribonucleoside-diphosphate reductase alpha chain